MATLLYFGRLGDLTGTSRESLELPATVETAADLRHWLDLRFNASGALLEPTVRIAVNNEIVFDANAVSDSDEIALMPPVGGG